MANEQAPAPGSGPGAAPRSHDLLAAVTSGEDVSGSESLTNVLVALAKSVAGALTGSASLIAEAAHSWADTGNEIFLLIANRRSRRPADLAHPFGHGREAYV